MGVDPNQSQALERSVPAGVGEWLKLSGEGKEGDEMELRAQESFCPEMVALWKEEGRDSSIELQNNLKRSGSWKRRTKQSGGENDLG